MIKVYFLPVEIIDSTITVKGIEYIHNAILDCTENPDVRKLVMHTTPDEDSALLALAIDTREPTEQERANLNAALDVFLSLPARSLATEIDEIKARVLRLEAEQGLDKS